MPKKKEKLADLKQTVKVKKNVTCDRLKVKSHKADMEGADLQKF